MRTRALRLAALMGFAVPGTAQAHSAIPGVDGFYSGLLHPISTPAQVMLLLGVGLLIGGLKGQSFGKWLGLFCAATVLGMATGRWFGRLDEVMFAIAFLACVQAALAPGRLLPTVAALTLLGGVCIGAASVPEAGPLRDRLVAMAGSFLGANAGLLYVVGARVILTDKVSRVWVDVGLRVAAAWLAAISAIMLALQFAPIA
ncbi:HupE/UreJ family protein [Tropicimonas isoalkanivorans]|uniref:HupE / UreJ protein n=1 Tax=Tropicimonas isoalkanivorans TaxID=441112 RepID=A0A1I1QBF8_9RHOB|nr:HupE/UreJ family protein [Tropicimonas isoalkanivorans]SFD17158.1 HupE / UreJ protein [Tropicimonas isoalkanivorans]